MRSGDIITWVLFAIIMVAFYIGLRHIYHNFVSGEADCCKGGGSCPACADCAKEETTAKERKNAAEAWKAIKAEAKEKKYACPACEARAKAAAARKRAARPCPACAAKEKEQRL